MIIAKLQGGLGNQLFQYAAARALAEWYNTILKVDFNGHKSDIARSYKLPFFNIPAEVVTNQEMTAFKKWYNEGVIGKIISLLPFHLNPHYFKEPHFHFTPQVLELPDNVYLEGYWQSEKYFLPITDIIRREVVLKKEYEVQNKELIDLINQTNSVSLHVRRGDYVANPTTLKMHGICSLEYYAQAIAKIKEQVTKPYFFIFSDDPEWVIQNLKLTDQYYIVSGKGYADYQELSLMSYCKHHIIANSSFSWWGAWLGKNPEKIVIAPQKWFSEFKGNTQDLLPQNWIKL